MPQNIKNTRIRLSIAVISSVLLLVCAVIFGFITSHIVRLYDAPVLHRIDNIGNRIANKWDRLGLDSTPRDRRSDQDLRFSSIFTPLRGQIVHIPYPSRPGNGGAVTSWDDDVILLTHDGRIYAVDTDLNHELTRIAPPENGFEAYKAASERPPYDSYGHDLSLFRYNDISAFLVNGRRGLVVSYTKFDAEQECYTTAIARLYVDVGSISEAAVMAGQWTDIYKTKPCLPLKSQWRAIEGHMGGGRFVFDGRNTLYLGSGDYHWDGIYGPRSLTDEGPVLAQDPAVDYGKTLSIDIATGTAQHISIGHRNMQGISIDRNGTVWVVEHGVRGGDELNRVVEGGNYGWPLESYGTLYSELPLPTTLSLGRHHTFQRPAIAWLPSIAVSGLTRVEGFHEAWNGDLLAASLNGQMLARIRIVDDQVVFTEFIQIRRRIRYVHQHSDGRIVLWTDANELIYVSPTQGGLGRKYLDYRLDEIRAAESEDIADRVEVAIGACTECHSLNRGEHDSAPSLAHLYGKKIGSTGFARYSRAMTSDNRFWTDELLADFLRNPQQVIPQTSMPSPGLNDPAVIGHIVDIIDGLANTIEFPTENGTNAN